MLTSQTPNSSESDGRSYESDVTKDISTPLKFRLWSWLRQHPNDRKRGFLRRAAIAIHADYTTEKRVLANYSSQFKTDIRASPIFGKAPNTAVSPNAGNVKSSPDSQHACFAIAETPECLNRKKFSDIEGLALDAGWRLSKNRNRELIWEKQLSAGRVRWWTNGHVRVHVERHQTLGKAKQLLYCAFVDSGLIDSIKISESFLAGVEWHEHHDVFVTTRNLPYLKITTYAELGLKSLTMGDYSHRNALEADVVKAPIIENYEKLVCLLLQKFSETEQREKGIAQVLQQNSQAITNFNEYLKEQAGKATEQPKRLYE